MTINVNFSEVEDFELLPAGVYPVAVTNVEESENPGPSGYTYLNWEFTITEGEWENRKQWTITSLSPKSAFRLREVLVALGADPEELNAPEGVEIEPTDYMGANCLISVAQESYEGVLRNVVKGVHPVENAAPKKAAPKGPKIR